MHFLSMLESFRNENYCVDLLVVTFHHLKNSIFRNVNFIFTIFFKNPSPDDMKNISS